MNESALKLPHTLINKMDAGRLQREVMAVNDFMEQSAIREPGASLALPKTSRLMAEMIRLNELNMLRENDREKLAAFMDDVLLHAPQLHMSFSAEPSPVFMQKLITYVRENLHPFALIQVGLQPTIGAGFMLRTTNKYYDFSVRTTLKAKHDVLMHNIRAVQTITAPTPVVEEAAS